MTGTSLALCLPSGTVFMSVLLLVISLSYMPAVLLQASVQSDAESGFREMMRTWPMTGKVFTRNLLRSADVIAAAVFVLVGIPEALILSFVTHVVTPWEAAELWVCGLAAALAWSAFSVILHTAVPSGRGSAVQNWLQGVICFIFIGWYVLSAFGAAEGNIILPTLPLAGMAVLLHLVCVPVSLKCMQRNER